MDGTLDKLKAMTNYSVETLPNGARLVTQYRPSLSVNLSIIFAYGIAHELPEKRQAAHFAEHMMFRKGSRADYRQRHEELEHLSANGVNAATGFEGIALGNGNAFITLQQNAPRLVKLLGEAVYDDRIEDEFFEAERQIVLKEQLPKEHSESYAFCRKVDRALWGDSHPYALATEPCVDNIRAFSVGDVRDVFDYLAGRNSVISLVGCYDEETIQAIRESFGTKQLAKTNRDIPLPEQLKWGRVIKDRISDLGVPYAKLIFRLPSPCNPDTVKSHFLDSYLSDSAVLARTLRDELGLCYGVFTQTFELSRGCTYGITATNFQESDADNVVAAMKQEVEKLKEGRINRELLERKRKEAEKAAIEYESGRDSACIFAHTELFDSLHPYEYAKMMRTTTAEDLQRIAQTYFVDPVEVVALPKKS